MTEKHINKGIKMDITREEADQILLDAVAQAYPCTYKAEPVIKLCEKLFLKIASLEEQLASKISLSNKESMKNFFDAYSNDIEGALHNMSQEKLLEYLDSDIFIGCASAATGIPERDFVEYSLEYFGFEKETV